MLHASPCLATSLTALATLLLSCSEPLFSNDDETSTGPTAGVAGRWIVTGTTATLGSTEKRSVEGTIPGGDSRFPFMPHALSQEIESTTVATPLPDVAAAPR